jgi:hypothetical protein
MKIHISYIEIYKFKVLIKMTIIESSEKIDDVFDNEYQKIRESLEGLKDIFKICFMENNIYYKCGIDNIEAIHKNTVEILNLMYTPRKVRMKLRELNVNEFGIQETYSK